MTQLKKVISLIGMTGCGKTSVGKMLAKKLGAKFVDLDEEIIARYGVIKDIFAERGEAAFRELELATLKEVIDSAQELTLLSTGGGAPTYRPSRELLKAHTTVIWLRRSPDTIPKDSPILTRPPVNGSMENYKRLMTQRYPIYRTTAQLSFFNSFPQRTASTIARKLIPLIEKSKGDIKNA